jgi:uncharacterized membrane protein YkvI
MIKASNPGMFIILNYTLMVLLLFSVCASLCSLVNNPETCGVLGNIGALIMCILLIYVWYRLFTWKCE